MGTPQFCYCSYRNRQLTISFLFFLLSSFTLFTFTAEGRAINKQLRAVQNEEDGDEKSVMKAQVIGSRPPRCERRCGSCGHCEAVQVPVTTQRGKNHFSSAIASIAYSKGDDLSNYKPMSWKCKCGNYIFNP